MEQGKGMEAVSAASLTLALLQSICAAVLTLNGIRIAIGIGALAAGSIYLPVLRFHQDAIRIPMLTLATVGAVVNLAVLAWIWRLRAQPSAQWRRKELTAKQRRSERLQVAMAVVTLVLVGVEIWTHELLTRRAQAQHAPTSNLSWTTPAVAPASSPVRVVHEVAG
jgi:uncharacterized membrane protein YeaQ/YmgE (transglycosylase-associated protein family)